MTSRGLSGYTISLLVGLFLVRGFILATVMPPFEAWDEYQHVGYIDYCARNDRPAVYQEATLDAAFLRAVGRFPRAAEVPLSAYGAATYAQYWATGPLPVTAGDAPVFLYEAQQPPLYYRLMAPIYRWCGGRENLRLAVSMLRLINVAFGAVTLGLVLGWIHTNVPGPLALGMGCWVAFHPLLLLNVTRVANDALAYLLGSAVVVLLLAKRGRSVWLQTIPIALLLPLAVLAKSTSLMLLPVVAAALVIRAVQREVHIGQTIASALLILVIGLAITWPYFSFNERHFGILTTMQEAIINHQANRHTLDVLRAMPLAEWGETTRSLWVTQALWVGGWSFLGMPHVPVDCYEAVLLLSALSFGAGMLSRAGRARLPFDLRQVALMALLVACVELGLMYHAAESYSAWSGVIATNPWYAALAIPWWLILLSAGVCSLRWDLIRVPLLWSMPIVCFVSDLYRFLVRVIPFYSASPLGVTSFRRLATLHPAGMGCGGVLCAAVLEGVLLALLVRAALQRFPGKADQTIRVGDPGCPTMGSSGA
jgi:hypothetical protein